MRFVPVPSPSRRARVRPRVAVETLEPRQMLAADFDYAMAERFGRDLNGNGLIDVPNTAQYAQPSTLGLTFSVIDPINPTPATIYTWSMQPTSGPATTVQRTQAQLSAGILPTASVPAGTYTTTFSQVTGGVLQTLLVKPVSVRDILIVSMGDSYSSGEGNPERIQGLALPDFFPSGTIPYLQTSDLNQDLPALSYTAAAGFLSQTSPALWADGADGFYGPTPFGLNMTEENRQSHRSTLAATAQYALDLERSDPHTSVTFVFVSQSGATTQSAIGAIPAKGLENPNYILTPETKLIQAIVGSRPVDQLFISLGGNDVGFTDLTAGLLASDITVSDVIGNASTFPKGSPGAILRKANQVINASTGLTLVQGAFQAFASELPGKYASVRQTLAADGINAANTFITEYPDPTRVNRTFLDSRTGRPFTQAWWGPAAFDVIPPDQVSATESYFVSQRILTPLNQQIAQAATANGWTYLGNVVPRFAGHGYDAPKVLDGAGNLRFFRTARESSLYQGPVGLSGTVYTSGTIHPNALGHRAIEAAILADLSPTVPVTLVTRGATVTARPRGASAKDVRAQGLTYQWDLDRIPGQGVFRADVSGPRVTLGNRRTPRVATLRVTNALGLSTEQAVLLRPRRA